MIAANNTARTRPLAERLEERVDRSGGPDACWPWRGSVNPKGYGSIGRGGRRGGKNGGTLLTHRVAYELANGPIPAGLFVCHRCDNPPCCNPAHLFLGTAADNNRDMGAKGRNSLQRYPELVRGENNSNAKLDESKVREIRDRVASGESRVEVALLYGVGKALVGRVVRRTRWQHVT